MTWAVDQPHRRQWVRRSEVVTPSGIRATVRPLGAVAVGLLALLVGAWAAVCVFVGPYFGYRPTSATTWQWTTNNWLLHLLPGAVAVVAGSMIIAVSPARRARPVRGVLGIAALLLAAAGIWFVIGPAIWPTFQSSPPYATGTGAWTSFWNQLGANLGPGLLLAFFAGMAFKASVARPAIAVGEPAPVGDHALGRRDTRSPTMEPADEQGVADHEPVETTSQPAVDENRRGGQPRGPAPDPTPGSFSSERPPGAAGPVDRDA